MALRYMIIFLGLAMVSSIMAQTTINPDVSAVGDFRLFSHNDDSRADEVEKLNVADPELELLVGGYLNPYARADLVLAWHGEHNAAVEELYATVERGLPLGAALRVGKYLLEFGRLNPVHPHAYSFIERPLPHVAFFGDEGLSDVAVRSSFLIPTGDAYTEVMAGLLKGDMFGENGHAHEEEAVEDEDPKRDLGFFGRVTSSFALNESTELSLGVSTVNGVYAIHQHETEGNPEQLRQWLLGTDLKYKYRPNRNTALQIEAEGIMRRADQEEGDALTLYGGYGYLDYRFRQKYNFGGIFEYVRVKEMHEHEGEEPELHTNDTWRTGLFVGWAPVEETSLVRLAGHWTEPEEADGFWEVQLQFLVGLGPHKPHNF
jgi:hypothetical protein